MKSILIEHLDVVRICMFLNALNVKDTEIFVKCITSQNVKDTFIFFMMTFYLVMS